MSSETRRQTVQTSDGRQLEVVSSGPEHGRCFLLHSGTPSAAGAYAPLVAELAKRDLRLVTFSRPGYAGSSAMAGRAVGDVATDVQAILDALKIGSFFCAGQSGGGPHALACAALLPDRVIATATLAGVAPRSAEGLDWLAGMGPENLEEFGATMSGREVLEPYLAREAASLKDVQPADVSASLGGLVGDIDKGVRIAWSRWRTGHGLRRTSPARSDTSSLSRAISRSLSIESVRCWTACSRWARPRRARLMHREHRIVAAAFEDAERR
ncbi:MAG: alpha/beta fold hydrolase [Candidatus Dormibacteria bacterium]